MCIYDDRHSIGNLQKLSQQGIPDSFIINEKPSGFSSATNVGLPIPYNIDIVNKSLSKIDSVALRRRRRDFNLCYLVRKQGTLDMEIRLNLFVGNRKLLELNLLVGSHLRMCVLSCRIVLLISKKHYRKSDYWSSCT